MQPSTSAKDLSVTQDNQLINAAYSMTLNEKRLLFLGMSKINPMVAPAKQPLQFSISAAEWGSYFGCSGNAYRDMRDAAGQLQHRTVSLKRDGKRVVMNWVDSSEYHDSKGSVTVKFGWSISHYLCGMISDFTRVHLSNIKGLLSIHSVRIYELAMQFQSTGWRKISVTDLRESLGLGESYKSFTDFRRWVIEAACSEINEKTDLNVVWTLCKTGRSVTHVEFRLEKKEESTGPVSRSSREAGPTQSDFLEGTMQMAAGF